MGSAESKGYCGLENQGSCCYLNAVLQILFMTKEFREHVESLVRDGVSSDGNIIRELNKLFNELDTQKNAVSADGVMKSLDIPDVHKERDAAEHLHLILKKTPGSSELFKITIKTTETCSSCGHKQEPREALLSLIISFKDSQDVEDAVKAHFDQMCGEYPLRCRHCNSTGCIKESEMITFPNLLSIQLRRSDGREVFIRPRIEVYSHTYDLYAIVNHSVSSHGRHYYADIKCEDGIWRQFDDRSVSETRSDERPTLWSSFAYLLVYRQVPSACSIQ